jgi:hypothetical protein
MPLHGELHRYASFEIADGFLKDIVTPDAGQPPKIADVHVSPRIFKRQE